MTRRFAELQHLILTQFFLSPGLGATPNLNFMKSK